MLKRFCCLVLPLVALIASAGCGGGGVKLDDPVQAVTGVPSLGSLSVPEGAAPRVSSAMGFYELLNYDPVAWSQAGGVDFSGDTLLLDPAVAGGTVWAVYALDGFPTDGSIVPAGISTYNSGTAWLGWSNYAAEQWEYKAITSVNDTLFTEAEGFLSGDGVFYVIVVAESAAVEVQFVTVSTSDELPGGPEAVIEVKGTPTVDMDAGFSGAGSTGGDGTITELTWSFDGADHYTTSDIDEVVTHTFDTLGQHYVDLYVVNDELRSDSERVYFDVGEPFRELLVLYNSDVPESQDLAEYYASAITGRAIDSDYVLGLSMGTDETNITRANYNAWIRDPLKAHLDASGYKTSIKYICLFKGVPYKITNEGQGALDSEMCMLYEDGNYEYTEKLWSGDTKYDFNNSQFYLAQDEANHDFTPFTYTACTEAGVDYTVSYLVGRVSAYTYEDAMLSIDRSLNADTSGNGWVIMDTHEGWRSSDTMSDPVWPWTTDNAQKCLQEHLAGVGYNNYLDMEYTVLLSDGMPAGAKDAVIGFTGWGVNHSRNGGSNYPSGKMYILEDLDDLTYLPGAAWVVYESFAGQRFDWDGTSGDHAGQGQICDFIRMGGTVAAGNCYEPYTDGVPDERRVMERYLIKGDRWIEACYKGIRYYSWHTIVLGDPLCRVVAE